MYYSALCFFFKLFIHLSFDFQYIIAEFFLLLVEIIIFIFFTFLIRMVRINKKSVRLYKLSQYPDEDLSNVLFLHRLSLIFFSLQLYCCITGKESYYCHFSNTDGADKVPYTYSIYV